MVSTRKRCTKCFKIQSIENFSKDKKTKTGIRSTCKKCRALYYRENKLRLTPINENARLLHHYGISLEEKNQMLSWQHHKCAICRKKQNGITFCVDHDHNTEQIRMLLCHSCNIGRTLTDDLVLLRAKAEYLDSYK